MNDGIMVGGKRICHFGDLNTTPTNASVAIVDDEAKLRQALGRLLRLHDFEVSDFESGDTFLETAEPDGFDCLLLDLHLPGSASGFGVLEALRARRALTPVIMMTAFDEPGNDHRALRLGASAYLLKPIDEDALLRAIRGALDLDRSVGR